MKYLSVFVYFFMYFVIDFRFFLGFLSNCMDTFMVSENILLNFASMIYLVMILCNVIF